MDDVPLVADHAPLVIPFDANTPVPDPRSSYLEHHGGFKPWVFHDLSLRLLIEELEMPRYHMDMRPDNPIPRRLLCLLTGNSIGPMIPEALRKELVNRGVYCLQGLQRDERVRVRCQNLLSVLERINRFVYQNYLNQGIHNGMLIEKLRRCNSYIELDANFVVFVYDYATFETNEDTEQVFKEALERASKFLAEKPHRSSHFQPLVLAGCVDLYRSILTDKVSWPVPLLGSESGEYREPQHLGGYERVEYFLRNNTSEWMIERQFLFRETGRLAHRHLLLAQEQTQAREVARMLTRGTRQRAGNASQLRRIDHLLLRIIIRFACPALFSKVIVVNLAECELTRPFNQY